MSATAMERLLEEGIKPNAKKIAQVWEKGALPILVFEPEDDWREILRSELWVGDPIFPMPASLQRRLATSDRVTRLWLARTNSLRLFVVAHSGSLLLNFDQEFGWSLEPGSTDEEAS